MFFDKPLFDVSYFNPRWRKYLFYQASPTQDEEDRDHDGGGFGQEADDAAGAEDEDHNTGAPANGAAQGAAQPARALARKRQQTRTSRYNEVRNNGLDVIKIAGSNPEQLAILDRIFFYCKEVFLGHTPNTAEFWTNIAQVLSSGARVQVIPTQSRSAARIPRPPGSTSAAPILQGMCTYLIIRLLIYAQARTLNGVAR